MTFLWKTRSGVVCKISDMADAHIFNAQQMCMRQIKKFIVAYFAFMFERAKRRISREHRHETTFDFTKRGQIIQMTRADAEYYKQFVKEIKNERD